jgi:NAD(P)-dependent dehydrogenase (short-subunit alcohol dehydrogenase family)
MSELTGMVAIVTGSSSGIGERVAQRLSELGAKVVVNSASSVEAGQKVSDALPGESIYVQADIADKAQCENLIAKTVEKFGGVDLLVNNAGVSGPIARLEDQPVDAWLRTIDININGMFLMTRRAIPLLRAKGSGGSIITMSSNAGLMGCPLRGPYVASKWALIGLTKTLAMELGPEGIRANAICPASVEGPRIDRVIAADAAARGLTVDEVEREYKRQSSLRAFATNDDIVGMVRFLTSPAGQRISGQALAIDGHTESLSLDMDA